jgi:hypothetical protein
MRPVCQTCGTRPAAIAYRRHGRLWFRSRCGHCIYLGRRVKAFEPRWKTAGYQKKKQCDRCGFRGRYSVQLLVYHVDGNLNNNDMRNLRTVCLNCTVEIKKQEQTWSPGDLEVDR